MKNRFIILIFLANFSLFAQNTAKKDEISNLIENGVSQYNSADYADAEKSFRKALAIDPFSASVSYNLGRTQVEQDKFIEASHYFDKAIKIADDKLLKSKSAFNKGNIWFGKKKYEKAIDAYKTALRNNPVDDEARYNLALAQKMLKKQQKKNKDKKKNKNKQNDQKKKNDKKKDQNKKKNQKKGNKNKQDQDKKKDGKKKEDKNKKGNKKDQKKQNKKPSDKKNVNQKQGQKRKVKLTPQQVKQLLVALKNKEKKTQNKIKARRMKGKRVKQDKDW